MAMTGTIGTVFVVVRCEPAFSLVSGVVFLLPGTVLESSVIAIFVTVSHTGQVAFAIICFGSNRDFTDSVFFHGLDNDVSIFPTDDEHGIFLLIDDVLQLLGNENCDAKFYLHGNHPFLDFFIVSANNHREMVIR